MITVPKIPLKAKERPEWRGPVPKGTYKATILSFEEPRESRGLNYYWSMGIKLSLVDDPERFCMAFISGHPPAIRMIRAAQEHWLGMTVDVCVRIREHNGIQRNTFDIIWPEEHRNDHC